MFAAGYSIDVVFIYDNNGIKIARTLSGDFFDAILFEQVVNEGLRYLRVNFTGVVYKISARSKSVRGVDSWKTFTLKQCCVAKRTEHYYH